VNIEEVAATDPGAIITVPIDINQGVTPEIAMEMAKKIGFHQECQAKAAETIKKLYDLFIKCYSIPPSIKM